MVAHIKNVECQMVFVQPQDVQDVACQFVAGPECPGEIKSRHFWKPLRQQRFLDLGGCLQISLHAVIGCLQLPVATGQTMFETKDAFSCAQPGMKLPGVKGLGHKVVSSSLHSLDDVLFLRSSGQKNCVDIAVLPVMSNATYQFQAVQPGIIQSLITTGKVSC